MTLRLATEQDLPDILRMAKRFHEVSPYRGLTFSEETSMKLFEKYLEDKKSVIIILSEQDGKARGMVIGLSFNTMFSEDRVSTEVAWWMDEEYRKTRDSLLLISAYEDWSKRNGSKMTQVAMLDELTDLTNFYTRQGFRPAEKSFIKEV